MNSPSESPRMQCMERSPEIKQIAAALAKCMGEIELAKKSAENPHFKKTYADLAAVREVIRAAAAKHGLSYPVAVATTNERDLIDKWVDKETGEQKEELIQMIDVVIEQWLLHESGEYFISRCSIPTENKAQRIGSAITYGKRYQLSAMFGVAAEEDDDGEGAMRRKPDRARPRVEQPSAEAERKPSKPPVPSFGKKEFCAKIGFGADDWAGKPLLDAGLDTLVEYRSLVAHALDGTQNKQTFAMLSEHLRDIDLTLSVKEPPQNGAAESKP